MATSASNQSGSLNLTHLNDTAMNGIDAICSVIAMPVEMVLRPGFSTRYFQLPLFFFTSLLMILLPAVSAMVTGLMQMIPFAHVSRPVGMFDIGSLSKLFFILLIVHGVRLYKRILKPSLELHSRYEGSPLPFFAWVPGGSSFWKVRIVLEPVIVFLAATVLEDVLIFQPGLTTYLRCAAVALAMKGCVNFFRSWESIRDLIDMGNASPILAKLVDNKATQDDLAPIHLASFPSDISPEIRSQAAISIARAYSPDR